MLHFTPRHLLAAALVAGFTATVSPVASAADSGPRFPFEVSKSRVVPSKDFAAKVSAVGSAITDAGKYHMPVTMGVAVGGESHDVFGPRMNAWKGNLNDHQPARHSIIDEVFTVGQAIDITAYSWKRKGNDDSVHMSVSTADGSPNVIALRDGDPVPSINAFDGQTELVDFLAAYVDADTGTIDIDGDQVIYLFELGTTDLSSAAADFQDLVVLVTLGSSPEALRTRDRADLASYD